MYQYEMSGRTHYYCHQHAGDNTHNELIYTPFESFACYPVPGSAVGSQEPVVGDQTSSCLLLQPSCHRRSRLPHLTNK